MHFTHLTTPRARLDRRVLRRIVLLLLGTLTLAPGELFVNGVFFGVTCEDQVHEISGVPVAQWKIPGATAIPADRYFVTLQDSPKFGPDTITINGVSGFSYIRLHASEDEDYTDGCPIGGYAHTPEGKILQSTSRLIIDNLKRNIKACLAKGGRVFIDVRNP